MEKENKKTLKGLEVDIRLNITDLFSYKYTASTLTLDCIFTNLMFF